MKNKQILFTAPNIAELVENEIGEPAAGQVLVETVLSTVSPGTEKANLIGDPNVHGAGASSVSFPRALGYSSSGIVVAVGSGVKGLEAGDRVAMIWSKHQKYNLLPAEKVVKISDNISFEEGAIAHILNFPLAAVRKTRVELGESAIVMGLGLLGQIAVRFFRCAGATPIIAADFSEERREEALRGGADYALDPREEGFAAKVKQLTGGGAKAAVEVTGVGAGLDSVLDCMSHFGRIALLGCTRDKNFTIDYYKKIHCPGITLIGAHTQARPNIESHPGYFTHRDDMKASFKLIESGRLEVASLIKETHSPEDCGEVYTRLAEGRFPITIQFDWRNIK